LTIKSDTQAQCRHICELSWAVPGKPNTSHMLLSALEKVYLPDKSLLYTATNPPLLQCVQAIIVKLK